MWQARQLSVNSWTISRLLATTTRYHNAAEAGTMEIANDKIVSHVYFFNNTAYRVIFTVYTRDGQLAWPRVTANVLQTNKVDTQCDKLVTKLSWQCFVSKVANLQLLYLHFNLPHLHLAPPLGWFQTRDFQHQKIRVPWAIVWHCLHDPTFSHFSRTPTCRTDGQTDRETSRLVFTARLHPQVRMPPVRNARWTSCTIPSSECAQIPNFRTHSIPNLWTRPISSFWTYLFAVRLCHTLPAANGVVRSATGMPQCVGACSEHAGGIALDGVSRRYLRYGDKGRLQNVSPPSVLFESSQIFCNTQETETQTQKNDGSEFWNSNSVIFENFLKFSKRRRAVPLQPIWTIMVAAKVDQSRVLVTKFRQNRLTLKGRSAGRRHTDRQTTSAENNGPSGLQSDQQTDTRRQLIPVLASIARTKIPQIHGFALADLP